VPNKPRVLIVDDNVSLCKTMSLVLTRTGCSVSIASDGPEAIEKVREDHFDMVFMDIRLPTLSGVDAYRRISSLRPETPVVMMTAYAVEDLVQQALSEGAYGVLYKPVDLDRVAAMIDQIRHRDRRPFVLIVDDDPSTCGLLRRILERRGYSVATAVSGERAVAMAETTTYDIVFLDLKLPIIDGLETYLGIKRHNPSATAVMITGYGQEMREAIQESLAREAYTCLQKPLDVKQVLDLVDEIWQQKRLLESAKST
jgi:two-component system response regulator HydG